MSKFGLFFCTLVAMGACDFNSSNRTPPSFAVEPFVYTASSYQVALYLDSDVDCAEQMEQNNKAASNLSSAISDSQEPGSTDNQKNIDTALAMASYSYAMGLFYDCNMRQQAEEDGVKVVEENDKQVSYRSYSGRDNFWDYTRFVTWDEYKDEDGNVSSTNGEADTIDGKMVNLYLQDDSSRTQTRIELKKKDTLRQISSLFYAKIPANKDNGAPASEMTHRSYFVEHQGAGQQEHLLGLRLHHHSNAKRIYMSLAHMRADGSAVLVGICNLVEDDDYNKSCENTEFGTVYYFDAEQNQITENLPANLYKSTSAEFLQDTTAKWKHGEYDSGINPMLPFFSGSGTTAERRAAYFSKGIPDSIVTQD